ncbi:nicotinate (nicotinamide) nucleotide adenylyltransferase [Segetibacter koreensis]|uniref:nicotinate (nicotinamide) nucleotide adenylyltransferase n=1 Tax=Segetibacter koreensis TaxID=398037 RepID=UPI0003673D5D|nr:nicotinate (nicotinamide) nucleotide adenylyltransferase [Segetibacter koreensis]
MKIGLYFGSFNPIHVGHLIIANFVAQYSDIRQVWFVVSPQNPLKKSSTLLNEYDRLYMVQAAIENNVRFRASDVEFKLPRPSYTIDTLTYLKEKYPENEFTVILGSDSLQNISKWKNSELLLKNYSFNVYQRPGFELATSSEKNIHFLTAPLLDISSTYIRKAVQEGKSIQYLVPDKVLEEIERNGYYKN